MNEITKGGSGFVGYEYKEVSAKGSKASLYIDGYESFGWILDENATPIRGNGQITIKLKRDRKILNKTELTRLQRNYEACLEEIRVYEKSKATAANFAAIAIGFTGTAFMALSTFAVTNSPPKIVACIIFAFPGFIGWGLPYFIHKAVLKHKTAKLTPLIEQKFDEIYELCEKGNHLLSK